MATTTPTTYLELSKTYQEQVLGLIEQSQKLAVESVSAWTNISLVMAFVSSNGRTNSPN